MCYNRYTENILNLEEKRKIMCFTDNKPKKSLFFPEKEYKRYIIGNFSNKDFVPYMLEEYSKIYSDGPKISEYYIHNGWTVIPCPIEKINRGCFLDLMSWLSSDVLLQLQENEEAFAIALHKDKSYFARREALNIAGDTVLIGFDNSIVVRWFLPQGLTDDNAYSYIKQDTLEFTNMLSYCTCKEFLEFIGAGVLTTHFNLI